MHQLNSRNDFQTVFTRLTDRRNSTVVYDIGAHKGKWTEKYQRLVGGKGQFYMFEANQSHQIEQNIYGRGFTVVLSDENREYVAFYSRNGTGDSYYRELTPFYDNVQPSRKTTVTLDSFIEKENLPVPHVLKLDTQGSELDILHGAEYALESVVLILCELPVIPYNENAPSFDMYMYYFLSKGFEPVGVEEIHHYEHRVVQQDFVFIRKTHIKELIP